MGISLRGCRQKNVSFKIVDVEKLVNEALDAVTVDSWKKCVSHCENCKKRILKKKAYFENFLNFGANNNDH